MALRVWTDAEPTCGSEHDMLHVDQLLRHLRLVGEHVEAGGQDRLRPQRLDQRRLVDDAAAGDVDQDAVRPERLQDLRVDEMLASRRRRE